MIIEIKKANYDDLELIYNMQIESFKLLLEKYQDYNTNPGNEPETIETKILFDADKLDIIGAIGIARSFMLAVQFGQSLSVNQSSEKYINQNTAENGRLKDVSKHSPFIEYELKFNKIHKKLHTEKAKEIGITRLKFMDDYFNRLNIEIEGDKDNE